MKPLPPGIKPSLWRCHQRAAFNSDRIVVGQVGMSHQQAETMVAVGWWEKTVLERHGLNMHQRYRFTAAGKAALKEHAP